MMEEGVSKSLLGLIVWGPLPSEPQYVSVRDRYDIKGHGVKSSHLSEHIPLSHGLSRLLFLCQLSLPTPFPPLGSREGNSSSSLLRLGPKQILVHREPSKC